MASVTEEVLFEQGLVVIEKGEDILKTHRHSPYILIAVHLLGLLRWVCFFMGLMGLIVLAELDSIG